MYTRTCRQRALDSADDLRIDAAQDQEDLRGLTS